MNNVVLLILDGWGYADDSEYNAIAKAQTPHWDGLIANAPTSILKASGHAVGLPEGQMGNSEVGHIHLGSGRSIDQKLRLIDQALESNSQDIQLYVEKVIQDNGPLHVLGLLSNGGVHSHCRHFYSILNHLADRNYNRCYFHLFGDGRDVLPGSFKNDLLDFDDYIKSKNLGRIATLSGRFYAMDRDDNKDRTNMAYRAIAGQSGRMVDNINQAISLIEDVGDESFEPIRFNLNADYAGQKPHALIMNFRPDRTKQLYEALEENQLFDNITTLSQLPYSRSPCLVQNHKNDQTLGSIISDKGYSQLRVAETEKYAHVTYFFNGGQDLCYPKEERIMINSNKVDCHSQSPAMKAYEITEHLVSAIKASRHQLMIANIANADMVGHSGNWEAAISAVTHVDKCLGEIITASEQTDTHLIVTADHGNAEKMFCSETLNQHTTHTVNPVPFIYHGPDKIQLLPRGNITQTTPTILDLMKIEVPCKMDKSLIMLDA